MAWASTQQLNHLLEPLLNRSSVEAQASHQPLWNTPHLGLGQAALDELSLRALGSRRTFELLARLAEQVAPPQALLNRAQAQPKPEAALSRLQQQWTALRCAAVWNLALLNRRQNPDFSQHPIGLPSLKRLLAKPLPGSSPVTGGRGHPLAQAKRRQEQTVQLAVLEAARTLIQPNEVLAPALKQLFELGLSAQHPQLQAQAQKGLNQQAIPLLFEL